jgi:hypothetical protein
MPATTVETMQGHSGAAASPSAFPPAEVDIATDEAVDVPVDAADITSEAADAHDDAVLDLIALEMAAPDPSYPDDPSDDDAVEHVAELAPAEPIIVAPKPEPVAAPVPPPAPQYSLEYSLGSSLIANGIVHRPNASLSDPLAPIRRMSQAEKIALFS